jgi:signal transduction histidine kinase
VGDVVGATPNLKGLITVSTRTLPGWAEIRIKDSGCGIPNEIRERIFDPFFTTKAVGKGTGQGLAIAHDVIVRKHQGTITVEGEVGNGTTFIVRLPLDAEASSLVAAAS